MSAGEPEVDVCLVAEGNYPFVVGGVSQWIDMLVTRMPDITFGLLAITAPGTNGPSSNRVLGPLSSFETMYSEPSGSESNASALCGPSGYRTTIRSARTRSMGKVGWALGI